MSPSFVRFFSSFSVGVAFFCFGAGAQVPAYTRVSFNTATFSTNGAELPEAPEPQQSPSSAPDQNTPTGSSTSATPPSTQEQKSKEVLAEEQLQQQKKQRVLGIVPNFNTTYNAQAVSLTPKQKFRLMWSSATDPVQFGVTGFVALIGQAEGSDSGYGGGIGGYAKRYGSTYASNFDGALIGNAILPSILHQDPRYFRLGYGTKKHRILYALSTNVMCKHDNTGKWETNYSNIFGNIAAGGISNLYIPSNERGIGSTFSGAAIVMAEGGVGSLFQEFWPDISRHFLHRDPTNGQDAINNKLLK